MTEAPLTRPMTEDDLNELLQKQLIFKFPCHTQSVERVVQPVSQAAKTLFGKENRNLKIRATLQ